MSSQAVKTYIAARVQTVASDYFVSDPAEYRREAIRVCQQRRLPFQERNATHLQALILIIVAGAWSSWISITMSRSDHQYVVSGNCEFCWISCSSTWSFWGTSAAIRALLTIHALCFEQQGARGRGLCPPIVPAPLWKIGHGWSRLARQPGRHSQQAALLERGIRKDTHLSTRWRKVLLPPPWGLASPERPAGLLRVPCCEKHVWCYGCGWTTGRWPPESKQHLRQFIPFWKHCRFPARCPELFSSDFECFARLRLAD